MKRLLVLLVIVTVLLSVPINSSANKSTWKSIKSNIDFSELSLPANFTFAENNAVQLKDGRVMVVGTKNSYIYNHKTQKWSAAAPITQRGDVYAPILLQDGRVMVFPEMDTKDDSNILQAEIYDPATDRWSVTSELNTPRHATVNAVVMQDGRVMIAGGSYGDGNDVEIYNPFTNTWSIAAGMNHKALSEVTFLSLNDGGVLALGGAALEAYNPSTNQWKVLSTNQGFNGTNKLVALADGSILFIGDNSTGIYNLTKDHYKPIVQSGFYATVGLELSQGQILITGADSNMNKGKAFIYSISTGEKVEISIPSTRPLLFALPNDQILALGTAERISEYGFAWIWDKLYTYSEPGVFLDLQKGYWAENEIKYLVDLNIIKGIGHGNFGPLNFVTRAEGAAMLARSLYLDVNNRPNPGFKDLSASHWAYKEVAALVDEGIYPKETNFEPSKPLTREEMARLLVNAYQLEGQSIQQFKDVSKNDAAYSYINKLVANRITTGYPDGTFGPKNTITRSEFSVFIARALDEKFRK